MLFSPLGMLDIIIIMSKVVAESFRQGMYSIVRASSMEF
jgi:hypothetical protein